MLKLESMEISGFKSFGDRTKVLFRDGITAVVGPNGCGKSNIGDAINWVLGEQSPKLLRGRQMADVIFNGSDTRKPTGLAEVSLLFSGMNGESGKEINLTRRLFRSGESEYLLNGARTRLKDIQELLRRERVGAKTYATIEQGRIEQILSARPKDIRLIVEEAAGVAGFKHKRRLTEMKLEATSANLLRVHDIVAEVKRQINSLKRQASRARRFQRLREGLRAKQGLRFGCRASRMDAELARLREAERSARDTEAAAAAALAVAEAELGQERAALEESDRSRLEAADALHRLDLAVDRGEVQIRVCRERIAEAQATAERLDGEAASLQERRDDLARRCASQSEARARIEEELGRANEELNGRQTELRASEERARELRAEIENARRRILEDVGRLAELRNRRTATEEARERLRARRERLERERGEADGELERLAADAERLGGEAERKASALAEHERACNELAARRERAEAEHAALTASLVAAREAARSAAARLGTLEDVSTRFAGVSDGVRALLTKGAEAGIRTRGVVADFVEAPREVEDAAEVYLQALLPSVILEDDADARRAARLLEDEGAGRTSLVCRSQPAGAVAVGSPTNGNGAAIFPRELLSDARVRGRLRERLSLDATANGVLHDRIGDALLVDTLDSALELHRSHPGVDFLTANGEVVYASGIVLAGGRGATDRGLLAHTRRTQEARAEVASTAARARELAEQVAAAQGTQQTLATELERLRGELDRARREQMEADVRARSSAEEQARARRRARLLADELAVLAEEDAAHESEIARCATAVTGAEGSHAELERAVAELAEQLGANEGALRGQAEQATELRERVAVLRQRQETARTDDERLRRELAELDAAIEKNRADGRQARARFEETTELLRTNDAQLVREVEQREQRGREVGELERRIADRKADLQDRERRVGALRGELEAQRESAREAEMARAAVEADRRHLDELCREELGVIASEAAPVREDRDSDPPEELDVEALEQEIAEIREKIERIGAVNVMAIEEFSELEERYEFLSAQQHDLETSMASLKDAIRRINRASRERFAEAFESIRGYYQETFQTLFRGGRADLRLQEGEEVDVLEAGVEILAQPPGKRLGSVQLLSGGEKAMSAIALLFSIFRYHPSPFCLLDEVDAPLDDANVGRFTRMLREYAAQTQFILITHNKLSMESADLLYGVTMEEAGVSKIVSLELQ